MEEMSEQMAAGMRKGFCQKGEDVFHVKHGSEELCRLQSEWFVGRCRFGKVGRRVGDGERKLKWRGCRFSCIECRLRR